MNSSKILITKMIFLLIFLVSCSGKEEDPYPEFTIPVHSDSYDISTGFDAKIFGKTVEYFVKVKFPAQNVQEFYETFLSKKGFSELKGFPYADKTWVKFNRESLKWDIVADSAPARFFQAWVDSHKNIMFKLTLSYNKPDELSVTCFLHPYSRHELFVEFDKWVADMGKEQEFGEFLIKYTKPDKKVDIERALEENPNSELIKKFAKAAEQDKQNISAAYKAYKASIQNK